MDCRILGFLRHNGWVPVSVRYPTLHSNAFQSSAPGLDRCEVKNFVGCHLVHSTDRKTIHIFQPKNLEDSFSHYIKTNRKIQTPGAPKTVVMRPEKGDDILLPKTKLSIVLVWVCYWIWLKSQDLTSQMQ
jgi:hypothetical protein